MPEIHNPAVDQSVGSQRAVKLQNGSHPAGDYSVTLRIEVIRLLLRSQTKGDSLIPIVAWATV
jgi:hypothetical protein